MEQLYYKYSPIFVEFRPRETFKAWEEAATGLQPSKLIPAIVRYQNQHVAKKGTAETDLALEYLEQVVLKGNKDPAVHNLLLSILARYPDERRLIKFIRKKSTNQAFFDLKYALRVCTRIQRKKAMIYIYSAMGSFAEAVDWALQFDVEMAKEVASQPEDDEVRKKLWLLIAKRVIDTEGNIKEAIKILGEVDPPGLVKIEDILPFFPDFVIIDDFKNEICQSLEDYNDKIERLKVTNLSLFSLCHSLSVLIFLLVLGIKGGDEGLHGECRTDTSRRQIAAEEIDARLGEQALRNL